jgi:pimeloyl-ACP methyl ester carboxylesterase
MTHGWPGSIIELSRPSAVDPTRRRREGAFHLVLPSIPGYGFPTSRPNWDGAIRIGRAWTS